MKAALEAYGADSNPFHQGAVKQSEDPYVIASTMAAAGVVLKRPVGSSGPFKKHAERRLFAAPIVSPSSAPNRRSGQGSIRTQQENRHECL